MTLEWGKTCFQKWGIERTRIQKLSCLVLEYNWFPSTSDWKLRMAILWANEWTWSWTMNFGGNLFSDIPISGRGKLQIQIQQDIPTEKTYIILIWESVQIIFLRCKCVHQLLISIDFIPAWQYDIVLYNMLLPIVHMHLGRLRSFWADFGHVGPSPRVVLLLEVWQTEIKQSVSSKPLGEAIHILTDLRSYHRFPKPRSWEPPQEGNNLNGD